MAKSASFVYVLGIQREQFIHFFIEVCLSVHFVNFYQNFKERTIGLEVKKDINVLPSKLLSYA